MPQKTPPSTHCWRLTLVEAYLEISRSQKSTWWEIARGPIMPDSVWFQVIHAATGNPAMHVRTSEGIELSPRIGVGEQAVRPIAAGTYSLRLTDADDDSSVQMEKRGIELLPGTTALVIVFDDDSRLPLVNGYLGSALPTH